MLLRIIEGRHEYTNFDSQLLISMNVRPVQQILCGNVEADNKAIQALCRHLTIKHGKLISPEEIAGREMPWKDWVFNESRRR
jgi:hypothetical protein